MINIRNKVAMVGALFLTIFCITINAGGEASNSTKLESENLIKKCQDAVHMIMESQSNHMDIDLKQDTIALIAAVVAHVIKNDRTVAMGRSDQLRNNCENAVKMIMEAQPKSIFVEIGKDFLALVAAAIVQFVIKDTLKIDGESLSWRPVFWKKAEKRDNRGDEVFGERRRGEYPSHGVALKIYPSPLLVPLFPIIMYSIDSYFDKKNGLDNGLDILTSSDVAPELLNDVIQDVGKLENKVMNMSANNQNVWPVARIVIGFIVVSYFCWINSPMYKEFLDRDRLDTCYTMLDISRIFAILIEIVALGFVIYKQNVICKNENASRMKKLEKLKQLLRSITPKHSGESSSDESPSTMNTSEYFN